ncbi:MAG: Oxygen-independent coproporphyrinogen-III oxidase-like protein HemZ [Eubacteriales bacterium SKADARSKE-1]|nr:Oxygen-independent coproporphyrinogen-III oxidase-like protein HemZ [Eubacteriales bacterium SKADARSKE-1]
MIVIYIKNHKFHYEIENLCRVFFPYRKIIVKTCKKVIEPLNDYICTEIIEKENKSSLIVRAKINSTDYFQEGNVEKVRENYESECERVLAVLLFNILCKATGILPPWGILTGVRPIKLMRKLLNELGAEKALNYFKEKLLVSDQKAKLSFNIANVQKKILDLSTPKSFSLYVSIPFCPTRCSYCSFVSQSVEKSNKLIPEYLMFLLKELEYTGMIIEKLGLKLETVYIGGGTPTTLNADELKILIEKIYSSFNMKTCREFTVEAGRPDTITREKLKVLKALKVTRLSINPQTLNDKTLEEIGRRHTANQAIEAFNMARECGFKNINMDLIVGLPGEVYNDFVFTLEKVCKLNPENITIHTLAIKRAASLMREENSLKNKQAEIVSNMLDFANTQLYQNNYFPYYLYRQSKMLGNFENIGWAKENFENYYNIHIMEETHSVISCGAGGVTKLKDPYSDYIERVYNFKFAYEYITRFDEIIFRKDKVLMFYDKL